MREKSWRRGKESSETNSLLSSERATLSESGLTTGWLAENGGASSADDNSLGVGENSGDGEASWALDIHEEGSWGWDKLLKLVLAGLSGWGWVEKINGENHVGGFFRTVLSR